MDNTENSGNEFAYMMLSRLQSDCEYFLGNGNGSEKQLWAHNIKDQIKEMTEIFNKLDTKPEWLSMEDIEKYEKEMLEKKAPHQNENQNIFSEINEKIDQNVPVTYKLEAKIKIDEDPPRPRGDDFFENVSQIVCAHSKYNLGDVQERNPAGVLRAIAESLEIDYNEEMSPTEILSEIKEKAVIFPVSLEDHSGISMNLGISSGWDSGQVGFMYLPKDKVDDYGIDLSLPEDEQRTEVEKRFESEIETYNTYLSGEVYVSSLEMTADVDSRGEKALYEESCCGFFGSEHEKSGALEFIKDNTFIEGHQEGEDGDVQERLWLMAESNLSDYGEVDTEVECQRVYSPDDMPEVENKIVRAEVLAELNTRKEDFLFNNIPSSELVEKMCEYTKVEKNDTHFVVKNFEDKKLELRDTSSPDENIATISAKDMLERETKPIVPEEPKEKKKKEVKIKP